MSLKPSQSVLFPKSERLTKRDGIIVLYVFVFRFLGRHGKISDPDSYVVAKIFYISIILLDFTVWTELIYIYISEFAVTILALVWMETARNGASLLMF